MMYGSLGSWAMAHCKTETIASCLSSVLGTTLGKTPIQPLCHAALPENAT
jgi:hypothetical protein